MSFSNLQNRTVAAFSAMISAAIVIITAVGPAVNNAPTTFI